MNLSSWIERQADFVPEKCAISFAGQDLSYAELANRISQLATSLSNELGVRHGDRIAYLGMNSPEIIMLLSACTRIGAVLVPMNWRLAKPEHIHLLKHATPCAIFVKPDFVEHVEGLTQDIGPVKRITYGESRDDWIRFSTHWRRMASR